MSLEEQTGQCGSECVRMGVGEKISYTSREEVEGFLKQNRRGTTGAKETEERLEARGRDQGKRVYEGVYFKDTLGKCGQGNERQKGS